jgi:hypothetical protein
MKKFLLAGAAIALIAGPAAAQNWQAQSYGNDGAAWWAVGADVDTFCKLNAAAPSINAYRSVATPGANGQGGSAANSDGTLILDIQEPATNTIQNASAFITYANSQCNTTFTVTGNSLNGGLRNTETVTTDPAFVALVPYNVGVQFGAQNTGGAAAAGNFSLNWTPQQATAGDFRFSVDVPAANRLLLEGEYNDFLKVTMAPVA